MHATSELHNAIQGAFGPTRTAGKAIRFAPVEPLLMTAVESAALLGMSLRKFHQKRPDLPKPVADLGPRHVRWRRADLSAWVAGLGAVVDGQREPVQLAAGKARKLAAIGGAVEGFKAPNAESESQRGSQQREVPSNPKTEAGE